MATGYPTTNTNLEAATVYLLPKHQIILKELRLKLRRHGIKTTKSKLVRIAISHLGEQSPKRLANQLQLDRAA
jgi:hypothetical protein